MSEGDDPKQLGEPKWQERFQIMTKMGKRANPYSSFPPALWNAHPSIKENLDAEKKDMVALRTVTHGDCSKGN